MTPKQLKAWRLSLPYDEDGRPQSIASAARA